MTIKDGGWAARRRLRAGQPFLSAAAHSLDNTRNFRPANRKGRREPSRSVVNLLDMEYLIVIVTFGLIAGYGLIIGRALPKE
jgi:hypothetical protein